MGDEDKRRSSRKGGREREEALRAALETARKRKRLTLMLKLCLGAIILLGFALAVLRVLVFYGVLR